MAAERNLMCRTIAPNLLMVALLLWTGCGSNSSNGASGGDGGRNGTPSRADCSVSACGGDLVGTWRVGTWCGMRYDPSVQLCHVTVDDSMVVETGTINFASDMTYTANFQRTGTEIRSVPLPLYCNGVTYDKCADSCRSFSSGGGGPSADGKSCVCSEPVSETARGTGTFTKTASGGLILTAFGSNNSGTFQYCVKGDELVIIGEDESLFSAVFVRQ